MDHVGITRIFNQCFAGSYNTRIVGGADEPLYLPLGLSGQAELHFREDFAASALHEAAHWCIAGAKRRGQRDFGYLYIAPPRSPSQQCRFFAGEVQAQALESVFATACNVQFVLSTDQFGPTAVDCGYFARRVATTRLAFSRRLAAKPDTCGARFARALAGASGTGDVPLTMPPLLVEGANG
jgi:elongation factor P hydroxylase